MSTVIGPNFTRTPLPGIEGSRDQALRRGASTALEGTGTVDVGWDGIAPDGLREWYENNNPYRNLATDPIVAERARSFVLEHIRQYDQKTLRLQRKWQTINYLLQGNSLVNWEDPDGIHSPQLFQMVENLEARITDAVLGLSTGTSEWFSVVGREPMDWRQQDIIAAYLDYILDKNKFKRKVPELVRTMLIHAFCVVKTYWENQVEWGVEKTRTKRVTAKGTRWRTKRKEVETVRYQGPKMRSVDPFWFLCDTTETDVEDMLFIGDRWKATLEECVKGQAHGIYANVHELYSQEPRSWGETFADWTRWTRSQTYPYEQLHAFQRPTGAPKQFYLVDIWGKFALREGEEARECVITIANGQTVLQVRENPFDDKHRPYAIARACKYPFDFHSVGPLDHAIQLSIEIDTHRSLAVEGSRLSVCPLVFTDHKADIGDSIYAVEPGKVFEVSPQSIQFSQIKSPVGEMAAMENILRRDIEETCGSPRTYMGGDSGSSLSATEYRGRIQEANKRMRGYIRSFSEMCEQILQNMHSLCGQYLSTSRKFRVLGERAKKLRAYEEVTPETFDTLIDFEFVAISNLHVAGMEATNLQLYLNTIAPFLQTYPGVANVPHILQRYAELLLGERARDFIDVPEDPRDLMAQEDEIVLLLQGTPVPVSEGDDDEEHIEKLSLFRQSPTYNKASQTIKDIVDDHYYAHIDQRGQKKRMKKALQDRIPPFQSQGPGQYAGQGSPGAMVNQERANAAGPSQTNGPPNAQQVAAPGRMNSFFQEQNLDREFGGEQ